MRLSAELWVWSCAIAAFHNSIQVLVGAFAAVRTVVYYFAFKRNNMNWQVYVYQWGSIHGYYAHLCSRKCPSTDDFMSFTLHININWQFLFRWDFLKCKRFLKLCNGLSALGKDLRRLIHRISDFDDFTLHSCEWLRGYI